VPDKILSIVIRARDEAAKRFQEMTGASDGLVASVGAALPVITAAGAAYVGLVKTGADLAMAWQENTIAVGDFAAKMDISTEAASALVEMAGDLGLSTGTLEVAFRTMSKEGIEPSIEGLIEVKTRLEEAESPADKLALATKLLGRSGADLIPVFENLTDTQLRNYIDSMHEGQIVTDEMYQAALRQRDALDGVKDQWEGIKLQIGGFLSLKTLPFLENMNEVLSGQKGYLEGILGYFRSIGELLGIAQPKFDVGANVGGEHHGGFAFGGSFEVGGPAGVDQTMVRFMASRGEKVTVTPPGGDDRLISEMRGLRGEVSRLARMLPITMRDAIERVL